MGFVPKLRITKANYYTKNINVVDFIYGIIFSDDLKSILTIVEKESHQLPRLRF